MTFKSEAKAEERERESGRGRAVIGNGRGGKPEGKDHKKHLTLALLWPRQKRATKIQSSTNEAANAAKEKRVIEGEKEGKERKWRTRRAE